MTRTTRVARVLFCLAFAPVGLAQTPPVDVASLANFRVWLIETRVAKPEQMQSVIGKHLEYQFMLEREGIMFAAGPLLGPQDTEFSGAGLIAIRAESLEEATRIADADPMHSTGTRTYTIRQWVINEGEINISIRLSGQNRSTME